ncbi:hypothetical protein AGABI2DRAFT_184837 [Agaricus bisporus var. bisporus H97]|uniref:hypothetical protein n=1 Tax=Agaricus bisporus var. bisporus (strain H97 / ATCC MYA-4626 / FGSC 10389) TaxID=936046 RepID=UPI00029F7AFC|nr:hypothetical protein AGABI2DRAFT_184837 [Agaricus bisporus var. bisporus H97]EKV48483.1 hypothetical protein AGABI2DRAFT_184837 [Agaricus bisporus var. bisporus H97]
MFDESDCERALFLQDMIKVLDRIPNPDEYRRVRQLILQNTQSLDICDDDLAQALEACPHIETAIFSGASTITDRTVVALAKSATNLQELDLSGCSHVTDVALLEFKSPPLRSARLNGVVELTDSSVSAIVKTCAWLVELEVGNLPSLTPLAIRDIWSFARRLRTLRVPNCPLLTDSAFPSAVSDSGSISSQGEDEKPLPHRPNTWLEILPPLILRHKAESLRVLDLTACNITDEAIDGVVFHAPRIHSLILTGCSRLTDRALESIARLRDHLDILVLAHVSSITDQGLIKLTRACPNLRCIDVGYMSAFELAGLAGLRRLSLVRVQKLTDLAVFALAEQATQLERLHLSKCMQRFSESPPTNLGPAQQSAYYRVFTGENILLLRRFLDKE